MVHGGKSGWIVASHRPGIANVAENEESRRDRRELEWKLDSEMFDEIQLLLGGMT